ncbi:uncharacterized protein [Antedon mediterranea]|uniref:uncharacterized protein n=1 Tax=Antedon mediterranea TaxID=105859 RepID=UPI003AF93430
MACIGDKQPSTLPAEEECDARVDICQYLASNGPDRENIVTEQFSTNKNEESIPVETACTHRRSRRRAWPETPSTAGSSITKTRIEPECKIPKPNMCRCIAYDFLNDKYDALFKEYISLRVKHKELKKQVAQYNEKRSYAKKQEQSDSMMIDIGHGILLHQEVLENVLIDGTSPTKLARKLFVALFRLEEVIGKSLSGKKCNVYQNKEVKQQLDPERIGAIIDFTMSRYPHASKAVLRQSLAAKIQQMVSYKDMWF